MAEPPNPANDAPPDAYQRDAATIDAALTDYLQQALDCEADPGAAVAGTVSALVRMVLATMKQPPTARNVMALILPSLNSAAESQLKGRGARGKPN